MLCFAPCTFFSPQLVNIATWLDPLEAIAMVMMRRVAAIVSSMIERQRRIAVSVERYTSYMIDREKAIMATNTICVHTVCKLFGPLHQHLGSLDQPVAGHLRWRMRNTERSCNCLGVL